MKYSVSLDTTAKILTVGVISLLLFISYRNWFVTPIPLYLKIIVTIVFLAIIILGWMYAPALYIIDNGDLVIKRPVGKVKIPLHDITGIRQVSKQELGIDPNFWMGRFFWILRYIQKHKDGQIETVHNKKVKPCFDNYSQ